MKEEKAPPQGQPIEASFSRDKPVVDGSIALLSTTASYDNARAYAQRHCWKEGSLGVYAWREGHRSYGHMERLDEWDAGAQCPEWLAFLESIFPGDGEAQDCVDELLGLSMTEEVRRSGLDYASGSC